LWSRISGFEEFVIVLHKCPDLLGLCPPFPFRVLDRQNPVPPIPFCGDVEEFSIFAILSKLLGLGSLLSERFFCFK